MNKSQRIMGARMGLYNFGSTDLKDINPKLEANGGGFQQDRMIKDKYRTLLRTLRSSYQGAYIQDITTENSEVVRGLININKTKQDYDDKILSTPYANGFTTGTVFKWLNTNTFWIVYLQDLNELAYFKGDIRKCDHQITFLNKNNEQVTEFVAVRGPVETKIVNDMTKMGNINRPNLTLNFLIRNTEDTLEYFKRYSKFYLNDDKETCWRIDTFNSVSMPNIIEVTAIEYYSNKEEDEDGVAGIKLIKEEKPNNTEILGVLDIKPKIQYNYTINNESTDWKIKEPKAHIITKIEDDGSFSVVWNKNTTGKFVIVNGDQELEITVESLF